MEDVSPIQHEAPPEPEEDSKPSSLSEMVWHRSLDVEAEKPVSEEAGKEEADDENAVFKTEGANHWQNSIKMT